MTLNCNVADRRRVRVGKKQGWLDDRITGIQVKYGEVWGDLHGKGDGDEFEAVLAEGEQIWSVQGRYE